MTATISYDRTVKNLIDELSATGHVTHTAYKKTSVTLHHNAGRLSHEGVLNVWKTRPASAHFDVDRNGSVAQYVKVNEYAWAAGNTTGNRTSIHIEMANTKLAPSWEVGKVTWEEAARLSGWLFAKVIGSRPTKNNFFYHSHWSATACAGPYMDKIYNDVLELAQGYYDEFKGKPSSSPSPAPNPTPPSKKSNRQIAKEVIAGRWGNGHDRTTRLRAAGYDPNKIQREVNILMDSTPPKKTVSQIASEVIDGKWGNNPSRANRLEKAGYNADAVQNEVNRMLNSGRATSTEKSTVVKLAQEVIAGKWGNDPERTRRLKKAGHNVSAIQAEVNRRLK